MTLAKFCPNCGHPTEGAKFCPECGSSTAMGSPASPPVPDPQEAAALASEAEEEREIWTGSPDFVVEGMASRTTKYILTTERIRVETGMIGKRSEQLDLFRVKDVRVTRSMTQRARKVGSIEIVSSDKTTPSGTLRSVREPDQLAESIRATAREARRRAGVKFQEYV